MSNNIQFPKINNTQVAVLFAELNTGIILNHEFKRHIDPSEDPYFIFETISEAETFCEQVISDRVSIEFHIYDNKETRLKSGQK